MLTSDTSSTGTVIQEVANAGTKTIYIGNTSYAPIETTNAGTTYNFSVRTNDAVLKDGEEWLDFKMKNIIR